MKIYLKKYRFLRYLGIPCFLIVVFFGVRGYLLWQLPYDDLEIPVRIQEEIVDIPPRPGVRGILISGAAIDPLLFSIDFTQGSMQRLDWRQLNAVDPLADVKITCWIDERGHLVFSQNDVMMEGHTEAGLLIQRALRTWVYKPYKTGVIRFWFNLPSKGKKVLINTQQLVRRQDIPEHVPIYNGKIHLLEGIVSDEIRVGAFF